MIISSMSTMDLGSDTKLLPPPPLDQILDERKRQAQGRDTRDCEGRRNAIDGSSSPRDIWDDFDSSFLRYSEDTTTSEHSNVPITREGYSPDGHYLTPQGIWPSTPRSVQTQSQSTSFDAASERTSNSSSSQTHRRSADREKQTALAQDYFKPRATRRPSPPEDEWTTSLGSNNISGSLHISSDASSSNYSRGSVWSRRTSQASYDTHGSSLAGDHADPMPSSRPAPCDVTDIAMGITSDEKSSHKASKVAIVSSPTSATAVTPSQPTRRYDHHRNPSWIRRPCPQTPSSTGYTSTDHTQEEPSESPSEVSSPSSTGRQTPLQDHTGHSSSSDSNPIGQRMTPTLPEGSIPPRTRSRARVYADIKQSRVPFPRSASAEMKHESSNYSRPHTSLSTLTSDESRIDRLDSPVSPASPLSPGARSSRGSSLRQPGAVRPIPSAKSSLRAASLRLTSSHLSRSNSKSSMASTSHTGSGIEELDEQETILPYARCRNVDSRRTSVTTLDMDTLTPSNSTNEVAQLSTTNTVANAVKVVEEGKGFIVEARGRLPKDFEREVDAKTTHLIVSYCKSEDLLPSLRRVLPLCSHNLLVLDLSSTGLKMLPKSLAACSYLEELNVSGNAIDSLPQWLDSLTRLRVLIADDARLSALPYALSRLNQLCILSVRRNRLAHLPSWLHLLSGLERLYVEGNPFQGAWLKVVASMLPKQVKESSSPVEHNASHTMTRSPSDAMGSHYLGSTMDAALGASLLNDVGGEQSSKSAGIRRGSSAHGFTSRREPSDSKVSPAVKGSTESLVEVIHDNAPLSVPQETSGLPSPKTAVQSSLAVAKKGRTSDCEAKEGKWSFLKKVSRKSSNSSINHLPYEGTMQDDVSPPLHERATSVLGFRSFSKPGKSPTPRPEVTQTAIDKPEADPRASSGTSSDSSSRNTQTYRQSYLALENISVAPHNDSANDAAQEDLVEEVRRVRALLCYLRDLDDLTPRDHNPERASRSNSVISSGRLSPLGMTASTSRGMTTSRSASSLRFGESSTSATSSGASSPIRRRPSAPALSDGSLLSPVDVKDNSMRRRRVILEIIASEESYLRGLQELCDIYVKPARLPDPSTNQPILTAQEHRSIFGNVEGLLQFHQGAFLPSLRYAADSLLESSGVEADSEEEARLTADAAEAIAGVFCKHSAFFRMYSTYVNGCDEAQARITSWLASGSSNTGGISLSSKDSASKDGSEGTMSSSQRKRFKAFMKRCRMDPRHSQLNLQSYTLLPVQRLPRYELLLKELARSTDPARLLNPLAVSMALNQISAIATSVNESKRQSEQDKKLLSWQARLRGRSTVPLVQPHRRLVRDGVLTLRRVVQRSCAFEVSGDVDPEEALHDGAYSGRNGIVRQVDCLRQQPFTLPLTILLCNDICITLRGARSPSTSSTSTDNSRTVELFAMLKIQPSGPDFTLCQLVGQSRHLRIVDAKRIYYFSAPTPTEAASWCESFNNGSMLC